ncbi:MAG: hypothetical protein JO270_18025 [Acidobacteriaceae bacterium]|nr:hypothetical protein [Acidobacteriaceae bacterium]MBV8573306.1 hypothetical protein [Acidobacteriaceae bacterium]
MSEIKRTLRQPVDSGSNEEKLMGAGTHEPPPFLRTWKRVYIAVLCYLAALIAALYAVTQHFRFR